MKLTEKMMKGIIFDMDGVVVDNHFYHFKAWMAFADKYKFELNEEIYRDHYNGKTNADLFKMIFGSITEEEIKNYSDEKEDLYQELYKHDMKPHKGLEDFLKYIKQINTKVALGTSAPTRNVDFVLDHLNLRSYFDVIVDGPQVRRGKPDPEVYLLCVEKLGLKSQDCIVFEDSLAGLESALRAGCRAIGVATSHRPEELTGKTNEIILDFTEVEKVLKL